MGKCMENVWKMYGKVDGNNSFKAFLRRLLWQLWIMGMSLTAS
jgi:DNA-directed RNA polymerase specialized sigma24 family protein